MATSNLGLNLGVSGNNFSTSEYNANWETLDKNCMPVVTATRSGTAYTASLANFVLTTGIKLVVKFSTENTSSNTLNVNSTGAKYIYANGVYAVAGTIKANSEHILEYNGTRWNITGFIPNYDQANILSYGLTDLTAGDNITITGSGNSRTISGSGGSNLLGLTETYTGASGGYGNVGLGFNTLSNSPSIGQFNVAIGKNAGQYLGSDSQKNTFIGFGAGRQAQDQVECVMIGSRAGEYITGTRAVFVGGQTSPYASYSNFGNATILGFQTSVLKSYISNSTVLGYDAANLLTATNQCQIGASGQSVYGSSSYNTRSDERDKADISNLEYNALEFINELKPRQYRWDMRDDYWEVITVKEWLESGLTQEEQAQWEDYIEYDENNKEIELKRRRCERDGSKKRTRLHNGLIAQEVKAAADKLGFDFGGFQHHSVNGGADVMSLAYEEFIAPLIGAVQELSAKVTELENKLKTKNKKSTTTGE